MEYVLWLRRVALVIEQHPAVFEGVNQLLSGMPFSWKMLFSRHECRFTLINEITEQMLGRVSTLGWNGWRALSHRIVTAGEPPLMRFAPLRQPTCKHAKHEDLRT
jgi:hypothetical protein